MGNWGAWRDMKKGGMKGKGERGGGKGEGGRGERDLSGKDP